MESFTRILFSLLATLAALTVLDAFSSSPVLVQYASAFSNLNVPQRCRTTNLFAEAPKYQKHGGLLQRSECVGKGSYLLTIDYHNNEDNADDDFADYPQYESGHVLALEIQPPSDGETTESNDEADDAPASMTTMTDKTKKDLENNDGWLRGPYTVSFGYGAESDDDNKNDGFRVLVKEVGYKSHVFATSKPGTPVLFGGKFKVPIAEGIRTAAEAVDDDDDDEKRGETKRVVLVSSGVGVGPCIGAVEELFQESSPSSTIGSIDLIASYRTKEEIAMAPALEELSSEDGENKPEFRWKPVITSETGRLSSKGPESLRDDYLRSSSPPPSTSDAGSAVTNTHYHIIGNGQLVNEWKEGLAKAGVPSSRVTVEAYFNHAAKPDPSAVDTICEAVRGLESAKDTKIAEKEQEAAIS